MTSSVSPTPEPRDGLLGALLNGAPEHDCDSGDFDRTICPDPCGAMHSYCSFCGARSGGCPNDPAPVPSPTPDEQAAEDADRLLVAAIEREYDLADPDDEGYRPAAREIVRVVRQMGWVSSHG